MKVALVFILFISCFTLPMEDQQLLSARTHDSGDVTFRSSDDETDLEFRGGGYGSIPDDGASVNQDGQIIRLGKRVRALVKRKPIKRSSGTDQLDGMATALEAVADTVEKSSEMQQKKNKKIGRAEVAAYLALFGSALTAVSSIWKLWMLNSENAHCACPPSM